MGENTEIILLEMVRDSGGQKVFRKSALYKRLRDLMAQLAAAGKVQCVEDDDHAVTYRLAGGGRVAA